MTLQTRIQIMGQLGKYLLEDDADWQACKERAYRKTLGLSQNLLKLASRQIAEKFLQIELSGVLG